MMKERGRFKAAILCFVLALAACLVSCGAGGQNLDEETLHRLSTVTICGEDFTLPCSLTEFTERGYSCSYDGRPVDTDLLLVPGKTDFGPIMVSRDGTNVMNICLINTDVKSRALGDCIVYIISYSDDETMERRCENELYCIKDWEYMGLTLKSGRKDVESAFEGIMELNAYGAGTYAYMDYTDDYRRIIFTFSKKRDKMVDMSVNICTEPGSNVYGVYDYVMVW